MRQLRLRARLGKAGAGKLDAPGGRALRFAPLLLSSPLLLQLLKVVLLGQAVRVKNLAGCGAGATVSGE